MSQVYRVIGKFHEDGNKDVEISAADISKKVAAPHTAIDICASASSAAKVSKLLPKFGAIHV
ncbi:hypothetical protein EAF00_004971 [Botryotinia globosa]|nr:hypothetical protein EAF00_004971 [Botryotinia globosa]